VSTYVIKLFFTFNSDNSWKMRKVKLFLSTFLGAFLFLKHLHVGHLEERTPVDVLRKQKH